MADYRLSYTDLQIDDAIGRAVTGGAIDTALAGKQDTLTFDNTPTEGSSNPVTSDGIYQAIQFIRPKLTASNDPANSSFAIAVSDAANAKVVQTVFKGKSAVINQVLQNGNFASTSGWTAQRGTIAASSNVLTYTITEVGTSQNDNRVVSSISAIATHKYFARFQIYSAVAGDPLFRFASSGHIGDYVHVSANTWTDVQGIITADSTGTEVIWLSLDQRSGSVGGTVQIKNAMVIDLTATFSASELTAIGTSVANLKTAWLKKFGYPLPQYIPYNAGSIVSNNATYQLCGRNIWDEEWEVGSYDPTTGEPTYSSTTIRSKAANYIPIIGGEEYYIKTPQSTPLFFYDANKAYITTVTRVNQTFTTPAEARYMRFRVSSDYGVTYNNDICVNLSDASFNGQYEAWYDGGSYQVDLKGVGTAQDVQTDGDVVRNIGEVDLGDVNWDTATASGLTSSGGISALVKAPASNANAANILCAEYITVARTQAESDSKTVSINTTGDIILKDASLASASGATIKAALAGKKLQYELATPTTEAATAPDFTTQKGYNCLEPVSGDLQSGDAEMTYNVDILAYIAEQIGG